MGQGGPRAPRTTLGDIPPAEQARRLAAVHSSLLLVVGSPS